MAYTSWGTRKALGRRYGMDPAVLMEAQRLEAEYGLIPGREARALQAAQQDKALAQQQSQYDETQAGNKQAGMVGTAANLAQTGAVIRGMTMQKGEPFFGNWGTTPAVTQPVAGYTAGTAPAGVQSASNPSFWTSPQVGTPQYGVTPATMPEASTGVGAGGVATGAAYGSQGGIGTGIGAMESGLGAAAGYLGPIAAGYSGPKMLEQAMPGANENLGHNLSFGLLKGEKDATTLGKTATGAAAGAAIGSAVLPGPGTLVGGAIGAVTGFISSVFGW